MHSPSLPWSSPELCSETDTQTEVKRGFLNRPSQIQIRVPTAENQPASFGSEGWEFESPRG